MKKFLNIIFFSSLYFANAFANPTSLKITDQPNRETVTDGANLYWVYRVIPDGDCGFSALGTTRDQAIQFVQNNIENQQIKSFMTYEIKDFYELKSNEPKNQLLDYHIDLYSRIRQQNIVSNETILDYLEEAYVLDSSVKFIPLEKYLVCHQEHASEEMRATGLIDCIAFMLNCNINVWEKEHNQDKRPASIHLSRSIVLPSAERTIDIMRVGVHFERLLILGHYGSPQEDQRNHQESEEIEQKWHSYNLNSQKELEEDRKLAFSLLTEQQDAFVPNPSIESDEAYARQLAYHDSLVSTFDLPLTNQNVYALNAPNNKVPNDFDPELYLALNAHHFTIPEGMNPEERSEYAKENYINIGFAMGWAYQ